MSAFFYHIGLDDTDSTDGMCTTFLTYNLASLLLHKSSNTKFIDYPNLIRLNPNIPWKTRGNAALVLRIKSDLDEEELFQTCDRLLRKYARSQRANSGLVLLRGRVVPDKVRDFSRRALFSVVSQKEAKDLFREFDMMWTGLRSQQGIVGALAGIGNTLEEDHTYELIAYRKSMRVPRQIERNKIIEMDRLTETFSSCDEETGRIMIMPHGRDPVLCGIRGESPSAVKRAFRSLLPIDNMRGWMIFRTNQGTGEHLNEELRLDDLKAYYSGKLSGEISSSPRIEKGGHVFFRIKNNIGEVRCAAYEPTSNFRKEVMFLIQGDVVEVGGGVRKSTSKHSKVLNLEYFIPLKLAKKMKLKNPSCLRCSSRMASMGKTQGFRCPRCGFKSPSVVKKEIEIERGLDEGAMYLPPIGAQRHLTRPTRRWGFDNGLTSPVKLTREWSSN